MRNHVVAHAVGDAQPFGSAATDGKAGSPARIAVSNGRVFLRVFLPYGNSAETPAFFDVMNLGRSGRSAGRRDDTRGPE